METLQKTATKKLSTRHGFTRTITRLATGNSGLFTVTSDARGSVTLNDFAEQLPGQFVEVGIAEQNATGIAAGLALSGKSVFLCGPACFYSTRSVEQIKNDIAYAGANVKVVGVSGGVSYGALGSTHHSLHDIALFRAIPGISVILPADYQQTVSATEYLVGHEGPVYMRLGRGAVPDIYPENSEAFRFGTATVLRKGSDCTLISAGEALFHSLEAAILLESRGISCGVVDVPTIKPLDVETILSTVSDSRLVVTVEEHSIFGGLGSAVAELLGTRCPKPMRIIGFPDEFLPAGTSTELFKHFGIEKAAIASRVEESLQ
jgi:transketolase